MANTPQIEASQWRANRSPGEELKLPSGNVALVRRAGLQAFIKQGRVPNSLLALVQQSKGGKDIDVSDVMSDMVRLQEMMDFLDAALTECVIAPKVKLPPTDDEGNVVPFEERNQEFIYTDEVDEEDKVFIFNFVVGGTRDLDRFRRQQAAAMAGLADGEGVQAEAEQLPGS